MKKYADWYYVREAENNGLMASMTNIIERKRTDLNIKLSSYFRNKLPNHDGFYEEDKCDDFIYTLNEYITENKIDKPYIDFPISQGTDIYLVPITDNLEAKIILSDEYYGGGDYSKFAEISHFKINENTTEKDVDKLIEFLLYIKEGI